MEIKCNFPWLSPWEGLTGQTRAREQACQGAKSSRNRSCLQTVSPVCHLEHVTECQYSVINIHTGLCVSHVCLITILDDICTSLEKTASYDAFVWSSSLQIAFLLVLKLGLTADSDLSLRQEPTALLYLFVRSFAKLLLKFLIPVFGIYFTDVQLMKLQDQKAIMFLIFQFQRVPSKLN